MQEKSKEELELEKLHVLEKKYLVRWYIQWLHGLSIAVLCAGLAYLFGTYIVPIEVTDQSKKHLVDEARLSFMVSYWLLFTLAGLVLYYVWTVKRCNKYAGEAQKNIGDGSESG
jgi:hypothetical protein